MRLIPHVSEKGVGGAKRRVYAFRVPRTAVKLEIKRQVETVYGVTVTDVRTVMQPPKTRRRNRKGGGSVNGQRSGFKKAYVTLKEGDTIKELSA